MISVLPAIQGRVVDRTLVFQIGGNEGTTSRFSANELTAEALSLEGLSTYRRALRYQLGLHSRLSEPAAAQLNGRRK